MLNFKENVVKVCEKRSWPEDQKSRRDTWPVRTSNALFGCSIEEKSVVELVIRLIKRERMRLYDSEPREGLDKCVCRKGGGRFLTFHQKVRLNLTLFSVLLKAFFSCRTDCGPLDGNFLRQEVGICHGSVCGHDSGGGITEDGQRSGNSGDEFVGGI